MLKTIWHAVLKRYYKWEKRVLDDPKRLNRYIRLFRLLPIERNKVVFDSFCGKGYGENPKYIANELIKRGGKYKLVWLMNTPDRDLFPDEVKLVSRQSLRAYYDCATAKAWVFNTRVSILLPKRKGQVYLQTWHGSVAIKRIERDAEDNLPSRYIEEAKLDGMTSDGILVDGELNDEIMQRSFWLSNRCELLRFGSPRIDVLLNKELHDSIRKRVRDSLGIPNNAFVVLYAPTFRQNGVSKGYIKDLEGIKKAFDTRHENTMIAIRLHPNASGLMDELYGTSAEKYIDMTKWGDPQEAVISSDCVITDYSSIAYDFAVMRKPVFVCMKDLDEYLSSRGVYDIFYHQPFHMNYNESSLIETIKTFDTAEYLSNVDSFYALHKTYNDGHASGKCIDWLIKKGLKGEKA